MEEVQKAAKAARIHRYIMSLPKGYDTILDENGMNISQGQKQLLTIARAMLLDAKMLILDEATSGFDVESDAYLHDVILHQMQGKTVIMITHHYHNLEGMDQVWRLEEGKLKELSPKDRLAQRQAIIKPLVDVLFVYLKQHQHEVPQSGKLHDAFGYALNQEKYLRVFLDDGEVPIDNNASERAIRGFCIGKKTGKSSTPSVVPRVPLSSTASRKLPRRIT